MAVFIHPLVQEITGETTVNQNLEILPGLGQAVLWSSIDRLELRLGLVMHAGH